jgi:SAM-dependent methyltransferase
LVSVTQCPGCEGRAIHQDSFLAHCSDCQLVFDNPRPSPQEISDYYSRNGKYDHWLNNLAARERMWDRRLRKLLRFAREGSLLDVGTGIGQFLSLARKHFSPIAGTEVSTEAARIARERYGLDIHVGDVRTANLAFFDNVTAFHVLEHLHEPLEFVRKCRNLLKPHGRLFFAVPNDLGTPRARLGKTVLKPIQLNGEPEIHLSHFTPDSLSKLLDRCGLRILDLSLDPYWDCAGWKEPLRFALMNPFYRLTRVNLYPTIWVVAAA